jgi:hypothetical protein
MNIRAFPVLDPAYGVPFAGARDCPLAAGSQRRPPPAIGRAYPDNLSVRGGIDYAFFTGHWWQADRPLPAPTGAHGYTYAYGTMTRPSAGRAKLNYTACWRKPALRRLNFHLHRGSDRRVRGVPRDRVTCRPACRNPDQQKIPLPGLQRFAGLARLQHR